MRLRKETPLKTALQPMLSQKRLALLFLCLCLQSSWALTSEPISEWFRLSVDAERSSYVDNDATLFDGAEGQTHSAYLSAGRDLSWFAVGLSHLDIEQSYLASDTTTESSSWDHSSLRRMAVWKPTFKSFQGHAAAFSSTGDAGWGGHGVQVGVKRWGARSLKTYIDFRAGYTHHSMDVGNSSGKDPDAADGQVMQVQRRSQLTFEARYGLPLQQVKAELSLLASHRRGKSRAAGLLRIKSTENAAWAWQIDLLKGEQDIWYDADKLVLHDSARPMQALAGFACERKTKTGLGVKASVGLEIDRGHRSHWFHLGLSYGWSRWLIQ
jgi:hypothetical protein